MNIVILIFLAILTYINYLIGVYYTNALALSEAGRFIFWTIHILANLIIVATPFVYRKYPVLKPGFFYNALQWCGYILLGFYSILIVMILFNVLGFSLYDYFSKASLSEKNYLRYCLAIFSLVVTTAVVILGMSETRKKPQVKKVTVAITHLPPEFEGLKILQMSDVHVGQTIKGDFVETLVEISNLIGPDIVVVTGDMVDGSLLQLSGELVAFSKIEAPLGKFMIPGNHEYYWGINDWLTHWRKLGFSPLVNQHQVIKKNGAELVMAGVHDYSQKSSPQESLIGSPKDVVKILLAHQPRSIYEAEKAGFDLQLSGHTHSGQYFPYNFIVHFFQPYVRGLHRFKTTWIYVNQGTGYWGPPNRFAVPPEITLIELSRGK